MTQQDLQEQLLISFHEQFAENQNHNQQSFIQVLSVLLTVIIGYGYVITNGGKFEPKQQVDDFLLEMAFVIATLINCFGLLLILNNAQGFRRDQFVVSKIRKKAQIASDDPANDSLYIFPARYNPAQSYAIKTKSWKDYKRLAWYKQWNIIIKWFHYSVAWMPNLYNILFFILGTLHILLLVSFLFNPFDKFSIEINLNQQLHWTHIIAALLWFGISVYIINRIRHFKSQLESLYA